MFKTSPFVIVHKKGKCTIKTTNPELRCLGADLGTDHLDLSVKHLLLQNKMLCKGISKEDAAQCLEWLNEQIKQEKIIFQNNKWIAIGISIESLVVYKGWVHVPDTENQGNYKITKIVMAKFENNKDLEEKLKKYTKKKHGRFFDLTECKIIDSI